MAKGCNSALHCISIVGDLFDHYIGRTKKISNMYTSRMPHLNKH